MSARTLRPLALAAVPALALSGCGGLEEDGEEQQTLTVFAAASLTDSFTDLDEQFEEDRYVVAAHEPDGTGVSRLLLEVAA